MSIHIGYKFRDATGNIWTVIGMWDSDASYVRMMDGAGFSRSVLRVDVARMQPVIVMESGLVLEVPQ